MKFSWRHALLLVVPMACAGPAAQRPAPAPAQLRAQMQAAGPSVQGYSAEARLTYFGPEGRLKGTATVVARRPNQLRYDLQGPHGGVLLAVASDGNTLTALDFKDNRLVRGPATAANFDRLLNIAPLGLDSAGWVAVLFGMPPVPDDAQLTTVNNAWTWQWQRGEETLQVGIDPASQAVQGATVMRNAELVSSVQVQARDARGLPETLHLRVPASKTEVEVRLRDVEYDPALDPSIFVLSPPRGAQVEEVP